MSGDAPVEAPPDAGTRPPAGKRAGLAGLVISLLLVAALYSRLDRQAIWSALAHVDPLMLAAVIAMTVPITAMVELRFLWSAPAGSLPGYAEAMRLTLVAKAFNL